MTSAKTFVPYWACAQLPGLGWGHICTGAACQPMALSRCPQLPRKSPNSRRQVQPSVPSQVTSSGDRWQEGSLRFKCCNLGIRSIRQVGKVRVPVPRAAVRIKRATPRRRIPTQGFFTPLSSELNPNTSTRRQQPHGLRAESYKTSCPGHGRPRQVLVVPRPSDLRAINRWEFPIGPRSGWLYLLERLTELRETL